MSVRFAGLVVVMLLFAIAGFASDADAVAISANIQTRHVPFGTILDPVYASATSSQIVGYTRCGDSAIWTGHYLAAEAFRYNVTGDPDALANVKSAIAGIKSLMDVTGTNLLARCLVRTDSPFAAGIESEESSNGIYHNTVSGWVWIGNTSRDQYCGVMFGLSVAYDMVNDSGVQASASQQVTRIVDFLQGNDWSVSMPNGSSSTTFLVRPDEIMSFLQIAKHVNHSAFATSYDVQSVLLDPEVVIPVGVDVLDNSSYFKFNLDYIDFYNLLRLDSGNGAFNEAYSMLRNYTEGQQNAFFNMIDRGVNGPNAARDDQTAAMLSQWLQRPARDPYVNLKGGVPVCGSEACNLVPVELRPAGEFLWEDDPFQLSGGGSGTIEGSGIDYILPYWMARYYGVLPRPTVQSSAAVSLNVAPDSIAVIYANGIQGSTLTVTDSTGISRPATVLYASAQQIDFIVPEGTAAGLATFSFDSSPAVSATAVVSTVAPTLFSMNGAGTGVAAATAVQTSAGSSSQTAVRVFTCSSTGCVPAPIVLSADAPVYLTVYGTGIRHASSLSNVLVTINDISVPVLYASSQAQYAGLDQIDVSLPLTLRGSGTTNVLVTVDGQTSNAVQINVQ